MRLRKEGGKSQQTEEMSRAERLLVSKLNVYLFFFFLFKISLPSATTLLQPSTKQFGLFALTTYVCVAKLPVNDVLFDFVAAKDEEE